MLYSDTDIHHALRNGKIEIEGLEFDAVQPASVDLHLSSEALLGWPKPPSDFVFGTYIPTSARFVIRPWVDQSHLMEPKPFHDGEVRLEPGEFALASTVERVKLCGHIAGRLEGKSSLARLGLVVHTTAGFFDPGFEGYPTLEFVNVAEVPILLTPGMPIAQMSFFETVSTATRPYSGKYQNQGASPEPSHYDRNFHD